MMAVSSRRRDLRCHQPRLLLYALASLSISTSRAMARSDAAGEQQQQHVSHNTPLLKGGRLEDTQNRNNGLDRDLILGSLTADKKKESNTNEGRRRRRTLLSRGRGEDGEGEDNVGLGAPAAGGRNDVYGDYSAYRAPQAGVTSNYGENDVRNPNGNTNDYSSVWGAGATSAASSAGGKDTPPAWSWQSWFKSLRPKFPIEISSSTLVFVIFLFSSITFCGMLATAHQIEHRPEGNFANCCRLSLHTRKRPSFLVSSHWAISYTMALVRHQFTASGE